MGYVSTIIVKDMSRFGREYLQVGYYTENYFPDHNVRFIAINDNVDCVDGATDMDDFIPIKNIMNELYAKDISRKVRSAHNTRGRAGEPLSQPPYGYVKDPQDKKRWIIDPEAAAVVREIFKLYLDGNGEDTIARIMQDEQHLNCTAYWAAKGINRGGKKSQPNPYKWKSSTIHGILTRQEYCGDVLNFKTHSKSFKNHRRRMVLRRINNPIFLGKSNPYMREDDARAMMTELREQYYHSAPVNTLKRVVIHKTTPFIREEIDGIMQSFTGIDVELVQIQEYCPWRAIRFGADPGPKAFGYAVKRGLTVKLDRDSFLLWTHGCIIHSELAGSRNYYKGSRGIPAPLLVKRFAGKASGNTLAQEILMLTKMNWNSGDCLYKTLPVTLDFAKVLARMSKQNEAVFDKAYDFRYFM